MISAAMSGRGRAGSAMAEAQDVAGVTADVVVPIASAAMWRPVEHRRPAAERAAAEPVHGSEFDALLRDRDLQRDYAHHLEQACSDRQRQIAWLQTALDQERHLRADTVLHTEELERRLAAVAAELAAERCRASYLIMQRIIGSLSRHHALKVLLRLVIGARRTKS